MMWLILLQLVLTIAGGVGLWRLWVTTASADRRAAVIVGAGFVLRAMIGQALFWISWFQWPIGRSLQLGNGFWFFALDGEWYLANAGQILRSGPAAILSVDEVYASYSFVQIVVACIAAFGEVASIAILLNCAAYLATCAVIVRLDGARQRASTPCLVALAAVAFGPGSMLWSLQLLKDTFLLFLAAAIIGALRYWQDYWLQTAPTRSPWRLTGVLAAMAACFYLLAGMRWYFALIIWTASAVFFALVGWRAERRRLALVAAAALLVVLVQSVRIGGGGDIPLAIRRLIDPRLAVALNWSPSGVTGYLRSTRRGFENTPGATNILAGPALASPEQRAEARPDFGTTPAAPERPTPATLARTARMLDAATASPAPRTPPPAARTTAPATASPAPPTPAPAARTTAPATASAAPHTPAPAPRTADTVRQTIARVVALMLPRALGEAFGLVEMGGGRGLWLFAELDTIAFDVVLLFAAWYSVGALRNRRLPVSPLFVLVVLIFGILFVPMVYTVNNFGTLLRLRQMLYFIAAIVPLTLVANRLGLPSSDTR
jgi:hypothetical protein